MRVLFLSFNDGITMKWHGFSPDTRLDGRVHGLLHLALVPPGFLLLGAEGNHGPDGGDRLLFAAVEG